MNIRHSLVLTGVLSTAVLLSACGRDENLQLGSRDDIVIMKNGVPVDAAMVDNAVTTTPSDMTVDTAATVLAVNDVPSPEEVLQEEEISDAISGDMDNTTSEVEQAVENKIVEPVTEVQMTQVEVEETADDVVEDIVDDAESEIEAVKMQGARSVNTEMFNAPVEEVNPDNMALQNTSQPMTTTPMKSSASEDNTIEENSEEVVSSEVDGGEVEQSEESSQKQNTQPQEKVEGGCYRNMLVATTNAVPVMEERRVVCENDLTPGLVGIIQQALINKGASIGAADGKIGNKTLNAIETYQRENGLAVGGVTYEFLNHLGIKI